MYSRSIEKQIVCIDDSHGKHNREILKLYKEAYESVLKNVETDTNKKSPGHDMTPGPEITEKPGPFIVRKFNNFVDFLTGIDLNKKTVELPSKTEYFEPTARILMDTYQDYLKQVLLEKKMLSVYKSERTGEIDHPCILLKELLYRFASEILQVHNENERDGEIMINGFNQFLNKLKKSEYFIGKKGVFKKDNFMILLETIDKWISLFTECVRMAKKLNANTDGISKGFSFLTARHNSLMTVLVEKYLRFLKLNQGILDNAKSNALPSYYGIDLIDAEAISDNNLKRTLLEYEEKAFKDLFKKGCDLHLMSFSLFSQQKQNLKEYKNSYILIKDSAEYFLYRIDFDGKLKIIEMDTSYKLLTQIKWTDKTNEKRHFPCDEFDQLTLKKIRNREKEESILEFDMLSLDDRRKHLIIMMEQYIQKYTTFALLEFSTGDITKLKGLIGSNFPRIQEIDPQNTMYKRIFFTKEEALTIKKKLDQVEGDDAKILSAKLVKKCAEDNSYEVLLLEETYHLIIKTNQLTKMLEKLASLTKAGGWFIFMSGMINLDDYKTSLFDYSQNCIEFLDKFSKFDRKDFEVLRSAIISYGTLSTFHLDCQSSDLILHLNQVTDPEFLKMLACYFREEITQLKTLQTSMNCSILNEKRLQEFSKLALDISSESVKENIFPNQYNFKNNMYDEPNLSALAKAVYAADEKLVATIENKILIEEKEEKLLEEWSKIDFGRAFRSIEEQMPRELSEKPTYKELAHWYNKHENAPWCEKYDDEVIKKMNCVKWGHREWGMNKRTLWLMGWPSNNLDNCGYSYWNGNTSEWYYGGNFKNYDLYCPSLSAHNDSVKIIQNDMNNFNDTLINKLKLVENRDNLKKSSETENKTNHPIKNKEDEIIGKCSNIATDEKELNSKNFGNPHNFFDKRQKTNDIYCRGETKKTRPSRSCGGHGAQR